MKKKKGLSNVVITLIIILLLIASFGIIWVVVKNVLESGMPHFKITKEECRNETVWILESSSFVEGNFTKVIGFPPHLGSGGGGGIFTDENGTKYHWKDNLNYSNLCRNDTVYTGGTVYLPNGDNGRVQLNCHKKIIEKVCKQVEVDEIRLPYYEDIGCLGKYGGNVYVDINVKDNECFILKSDLTTSWLDENCEIQKGECTSWGRRGSDGIALCKKETKKYKCGDYQVDVWNQIK